MRERFGKCGQRPHFLFGCVFLTHTIDNGQKREYTDINK